LTAVTRVVKLPAATAVSTMSFAGAAETVAGTVASSRGRGGEKVTHGGLLWERRRRVLSRRLGQYMDRSSTCQAIVEKNFWTLLDGVIADA
jgi:hypothetical protein